MNGLSKFNLQSAERRMTSLEDELGSENDFDP